MRSGRLPRWCIAACRRGAPSARRVRSKSASEFKMQNSKCKNRTRFAVRVCILHCLTAAAAASLLVLAGCAAPPAPSPNYREYAYVTNGRTNTVSVLDLRTFGATATVAVGRNPNGIAVSPTRNEVYVVNTDSDNVSFLDAERNVVLATV